MDSEMGYRRMDSRIDASVNFSMPHKDGGLIETRFVQRRSDRFIVYISSMTGCDKACRFCHLTQTGQTTSTCLSREQMVEQAETVLDAIELREATTVHFNFMARGEPLSNPDVDHVLFSMLKDAAVRRGLKCRVKISSIMPQGTTSHRLASLVDLDSPPVDFYYSLYKIDSDWRKRWIPKSVNPSEALGFLADWQGSTSQRVILHWALIEGENDSNDDAVQAVALARSFGLEFDWNLVRYNPADAKSSEASPEKTAEYAALMNTLLGSAGRTRIVPRVGFDVKASCGMFLEAKDFSKD